MAVTKQLQIGTDKYEITNSFFYYLITKTNVIGDYNKCYQFTRNAINNALKGEVQKVTTFKRKKIDFEI